MKKWIKRTLLGLAGLSVALGGLAACSHRHHAGWNMTEADMTQMRERFITKASNELNLDEAQKAKLGALADALKAQRQALVTQGDNPREQVQALLAGAQFDRVKAQALIDGKTGAVHDKAPAVVAALGDFFDSLKPEQQQKVRDFLAKGRHHGWGRG